MSSASKISSGNKYKPNDSQADKNLDFNNHIAFKTSIQCKIAGSNNSLDRCSLSCPNDYEITDVFMSRDPDNVFESITFWILIIFWAFGSSMLSAIGPIQDTFCHQLIETDRKKLMMLDKGFNSAEIAALQSKWNKHSTSTGAVLITSSIARALPPRHRSELFRYSPAVTRYRWPRRCAQAAFTAAV